MSHVYMCKLFPFINYHQPMPTYSELCHHLTNPLCLPTCLETKPVLSFKYTVKQAHFFKKSINHIKK